VRYVWLTIIGLSLVPAAIASFVLNPLTLVVLGPDGWRERVTRLHPYRWSLAASLAIFGVATFVYGLTYGF
jgi:hypothetical protein